MSDDTPKPSPDPSAAPVSQRPPAEYSVRNGQLHRFGQPLACPFVQPFIIPSAVRGVSPKINRIRCGSDCALFGFEVIAAKRLDASAPEGVSVPIVTLSCGSGRTLPVDVLNDKSTDVEN